MATLVAEALDHLAEEAEHDLRRGAALVIDDPVRLDHRRRGGIELEDRRVVAGHR